MGIEMRFRKISLGIFASVAFLLVPHNIAFAVPLLKVDFGVSGAASPVQSGFTGIAGEVSETTHNESIGPYSVSLDGQGFYSTGGNSNNIPSGVRNLYRDYFYNNSTINGDGVVLSLGGFDANKQYDVTLWSYDADNTFSSTPTSWSPFGGTTGNTGSITNFATPYPTTLNDFSTTLQLTSTTGTLNIFGTTTGGNDGTRLNAVRVKDGATSLLSLDFGRASQPSSPTQATYTSLAGEVAQPIFSQSVGVFNVSLEGQGFYNTTSSNAALVDPSVRDFYRDYYYNNSITPGEGIKLTIDGVTPNTDYDLTLHSYDADNFSPTATTWTPMAASGGTIGNVTNQQSPYPTTLTDYTTTVRIHSSSTSLQLLGTTTGGTGGTRLNGFELSVAAPGVNGDYNNNGVVDAADYVIWRKNSGTTNTLPHDPTGGTIGPQQYNTWRSHFGQSAAGSGSSLDGATVPEPAALALIALGLVLISSLIRFGGRRS
jgi:hypothetical protein